MHRLPLLRKSLAVAALATAAVFMTGTAANALQEPRVPENVGQYFATGLVPRLADLFGPRAGAEVVFDSAAKVGSIRRVLSWTEIYLSGAKTGEPTQLTNNWVAPITAADGTVAGVATVWINPASDQPELADFSAGAALAAALAAAPTGALIIRDDLRSAWFATDGTTLTPLVSGSSGVAAQTTPDAYQRSFTLASPASVESAPNRGLLIAVPVLGVVVVLLAVFVLLPDRRRRRAAAAALPAGESAGAEVTVASPVTGPNPVVTVVASTEPAAAKSATAKKPVPVKPVPAKRPPAQEVS